MKNFRYNIFVSVALGLIPLCSLAQNTSNEEEIKYRDDINSIKMYKSVEKSTDAYGEANDEYLITLESFVTGQKETHEQEVRKPMDIAMVLDVSGSMVKNIGGGDYYRVPRNIEIGYNIAKYADFEVSRGWSDNHPVIIALSSTSSGQSSELYYRHTDGKYYRIDHGYWSYGTSGAQNAKHENNIVDENGNILKGYIEYIYFTTDETVVNPFSGNSLKKRYFLGYNIENGKYEALPNDNGVTAPFKLKEGATEGSKNLEDYYALSGYCVCSGEAGGDNHKPTSAQETAAGNVILYKSNNLYTQSRIGALREATSSFLDVIAQDDEDNLAGTSEHHRFGLVKFASNASDETGNMTYEKSQDDKTRGNYTQIVMPVTSIVEGINTAKGWMDQLVAGGYTYAQLGLAKAQTMFSNATDGGSKRDKTLVLFSDDNPGANDSFDSSVADIAIETAKALKAAGVTIYVVGLIENPSDKVIRYFERVSSDYPDAVSMDDPGSGKQFDKYFSLATTGEQLKNIFTTIASNEAKTEIGYDLNDSHQVVLDALTKHFKLPDNVTADDLSRIRVYTREFKGIVGEAYNFDSNLVPLEGATVTLGGKDNREIIVSGFDFAENWCGRWRSVDARGNVTDVWQGRELVITIPIVVDPANPGGATVATNEAYSGIYVAKDDGTPDMSKAIQKFNVPAVSLPNIVIVKTGMAKNDCAIFKIIKVDENNKEEEGFVPFTVMAISDGKQAKAKVKLQSEGRYKVVEDDWSWSYTVVPQGSGYTVDDSKTIAADNYVIRNVGEGTEDTTEKGTVFKFKNEKRSGIPAHDEDAVNNVFFTPNTIVRP